MARLWDKGQPVDEQVLRYTVGEDPELDARLVPHDVRASIAHARMLQEQGYLKPEEFTAIETGLNALAEEHARGEWEILREEEDVHTALENRLGQKIGEAAERLHLGRSRNDQVLAALRLYLKEAGQAVIAEAGAVVRALAALEESQGSVALPGYTHMQRAMPSTVGLWAGAYRSEIEDDIQGVTSALRRVDKNPLGSAAGYGVPVVSIDRSRTAELLDFAEVHDPVTAVQLSRGKGEAALLFELQLLMQDLGRLASDLCLFATQEYRFVALPERFTTGSSIMPQKRNPDVFELMRGRSAQMMAYLVEVLQITLKMPSGYHRDLQLIKPPLFKGIDICLASLGVLQHCLPELRFNPEATEAAADPDLRATEEAYRLVQETGIPFRQAYREVAARLRVT